MNEPRKYEYDAILHEDPDSGGAYVIFPWDLKKEFGKGRVKVHAEFDGTAYDGSIVNIGRSGTITGLKVAGCSGCGG